MGKIDPLRMLEIVDVVFAPLAKLIALVLPEYAEAKLNDSAVRERIVRTVDERLVKQVPEARLIPEDKRRRLIRRLIDIFLDEVLLE